MRDSIKHKIHRLIHAINEALIDSTELSDSADEVRDEGFDLFLFLEATVVLNRDGEILAMDAEDWDEDEAEEFEGDTLLEDETLRAAEASAQLSAEISTSDKDFLKTIGIRLGD